MKRRDFVRMAGGVLAGGAVAGYAQAGANAALATTLSTHASLDRDTFHALRRFAKTAFGNIAHIDAGRGSAALFLHGFPLNSFQWRGALDRLWPYHRCIAPDFLGMGYTEVADKQDVGPDAQVDMLLSLLDTLAIPSVDLVANDSGGAVAQLLMVRHPQRVRSLLLTNCDAETDSPPPALLPVIELSKQGRFADQWLAPWLADKALARSKEGIGGLCYADPTHPTDEAIDTYFTPLLASARSKALLHAYAVALERNPLVGIEAKLKHSSVPTRIVWGTADTIFSRESPDYLGRTFGNVRGVRRLEGYKLFWPEERPDIIAEEARALWNV